MPLVLQVNKQEKRYAICFTSKNKLSMKIFVKKSKNEVCYIRAWREEEQAKGATADERFHLKSSGECVINVIPRF